MNQRYLAVFVDAESRDSFKHELVAIDGVMDAKIIEARSSDIAGFSVIFEAPIHEEAFLFRWLDAEPNCRTYSRQRTYTIS